jgi:uncharacterized protein YlxW (UPF0749 family)
MNAKTIRNYCICLCVGLLVGIAGCYFIAKGQFDKRYNAISNELATSKSLYTDLQATNTRLQSNYSRATATVERLQKQIDADNSRFNETIDGLKSAIGKTAEGLGQSTEDIQSVIDGLESIKSLIRTLP